MKEANANDLVDQVDQWEVPRTKVNFFTFTDDWGSVERPENSFGGT